MASRGFLFSRLIWATRDGCPYQPCAPQISLWRLPNPTLGCEGDNNKRLPHNQANPAPESKVFSANCGRSLSLAIDRWRGACRSVIQVEAKLELSCVRHEAGMPWRIEHDFNMNFLDTGQPRELGLYVAFEKVAHTASGSRHGHLDMNALPALLQGHNHTGVNQTQIHNIDRNLRVVNGLQLIPDHLLAEGPFLNCRCLCRRRIGESQGIRILGIDTVHVASIGSHRVAAAQGLHDPYDGTGRESTANPAGDIDDLTSPTQRDRFTRTHISSSRRRVLFRRHGFLFPSHCSM